MDDVEVTRACSAFEAMLCDHVPVFTVSSNNVLVDHCACCHLLEGLALLNRKACWCALLHHNKGEHRHISIATFLSASLEDLLNLHCLDRFELVVSDTIAVEEDACRGDVIRLLELAQALAHLICEADDDLSTLNNLHARFLRSDDCVVLGALHIHRRHECRVRWLWTPGLWVVDVEAHHHRRCLAQQCEATVRGRRVEVGSA
mmetsp:Transcript_15113/g.30330  ORF Transcript_15113/g.30330 Transcript_15113/m.30330 type:complete len:203 (-) Transcript_15113:1917-2525(-)